MITMLAAAWDVRLADLIVAVLSAVLAGRRPAADPVTELTRRLRHPVRWSLTHPVQAIRRALTARAGVD